MKPVAVPIPSRSRRLTQKELADQLGVSQATISRAISSPDTVSKTLRKRVQAVLESVDYTPNLMARSLVSSRSRTIGVITTATTVPSHMIRLTALTAQLMDRGWLVLNALSDGRPESESRAIDEFRGRIVDGLISIHRPHVDDHAAMERFRRDGKPVVVLSAEPVERTDTVSHDIAGGIGMAVSHLASRGRRRIALLMMGSGSPEMHQREVGFRLAMQREGLPVHEPWIIREKSRSAQRRWAPLHEVASADVTEPESDYDIGYRAARQVLSDTQLPDAIVASSDRLAIGAMHALRLAGLRVPEDICITGMDGLDEGRFVYTPLTTIALDDAALGRRAADLMLERLNHVPDHDSDAAASPQRVLLPGRLIVRESTGAKADG